MKSTLDDGYDKKINKTTMPEDCSTSGYAPRALFAFAVHRRRGEVVNSRIITTVCIYRETL